MEPEKKQKMKPIKKEKQKVLGIELPFIDYVLIRGSIIRELQQKCRQAEFDAALRASMITKILLYESSNKKLR